jgi:hypothetical protein
VTIRLRVTNTAQLRTTARRFRAAANGGLQRDLSAGISREGRPVLRQIKTTVRALQIGSTKGGMGRPQGSTNLRGRLAAATTMDPHGVGVRFEVHGMRVHPKWGHRLAKLTDTELEPRWRHPVFRWAGRARTKWTEQTGQPWFFVTIRAAEDKFAAAVRRAMEKTARKILG